MDETRRLIAKMQNAQALLDDAREDIEVARVVLLLLSSYYTVHGSVNVVLVEHMEAALGVTQGKVGKAKDVLDVDDIPF